MTDSGAKANRSEEMKESTLGSSLSWSMRAGRGRQEMQALAE
jgi:hypothetical protein